MQFDPLPKNLLSEHPESALETLSQTSMLERCLLVNHARLMPDVGDIVDFGTYLGGSTYLLAKGLDQNKNIARHQKFSRIHGYAMFGERGTTRHFDEDLVARVVGGPIRHDVEAFQKVVAPYRGYINLYPGDITQLTWCGRPIALAHIDIAKRVAAWQSTWKMIAGAYVPGHTRCIHQDYGSISLPWLTYGLGVIGDYVTVHKEIVTGSLYFKIDKEIPDELNARIIADDFTLAERLELTATAHDAVAAASKHLGRSDNNGSLRAGKLAFCHYWFGDKEEARRLMAPIKHRFKRFYSVFFERDEVA